MWDGVLVVVAHADDEVLGAGGTIARIAREGAAVRCLVLADGVTSRADGGHQNGDEIQTRKRHARRAADVLGITDLEFLDLPDNRLDTVPLLELAKAVEKAVSWWRPDTVLTHHHGDLNIDHQLAYRAVITACRPVPGQSVRRVLSFEVPSSTDWSFGPAAQRFAPNFFVDVSGVLDKKLGAMSEYKDEGRPFPHPRSGEALEATAKRWGTVCGVPAAEAFELVREVF